MIPKSCNEPPVLNSLQLGRAVAAIAVACCHAEQFARQFVDIPAGLAIILAKGYLGVDFFFVLSGFIIYYSNRERLSAHRWAEYYAWSRLTRIFIPYLPVGIGIALIYLLQPALAAHRWNWFSTLTLLPSAGQPALGIAWTLQHEVIFYGLMLVFLQTGKLFACCLLWIAAIAGTRILGGVELPGLSIIDLEFIIGVIIAHCHRSDRRPGRFPIAMAALLCAACAWSPWILARLGFAAGLGLLMLPILRWDLAGRLRFSAAGLFLGSASYAVYIVHVPVLRAASRLFGSSPGPLLLPLLIGTALLAGVVYHVVWERPVLLLTRRLIGPSRTEWREGKVS